LPRSPHGTRQRHPRPRRLREAILSPPYRAGRRFPTSSGGAVLISTRMSWGLTASAVVLMALKQIEASALYSVSGSRCPIHANRYLAQMREHERGSSRQRYRASCSQKSVSYRRAGHRRPIAPPGGHVLVARPRMRDCSSSSACLFFLSPISDRQVETDNTLISSCQPRSTHARDRLLWNVALRQFPPHRLPQVRHDSLYGLVLHPGESACSDDHIALVVHHVVES